MNKRLLVLSIFTACLIILGNAIADSNKPLYGMSPDTIPTTQPLVAQTDSRSNTELEYEFLGQKIPLTVKKDTTAVIFKAQDRSSGGESYYTQLQDQLSIGDRSSGGEATVEITPLGQNYALVELATEGGNISSLENEIQRQEYVTEVLPVLTISGNGTNPDKNIILPNEILVSFEADLSEAERDAILAENNLELIRPVRFSPNLFVVKSLNVSGIEVLQVANRLNSVTSIESASPNFIQTLLEETSPLAPLLQVEGNSVEAKLTQIQQKQNQKDNLATNPNSDSLLPIQWHLNSNPLTYCLNNLQAKTLDSIAQCSQNGNAIDTDSNTRTDIKAVESWQNNARGEGVLVAVVDTLIQWDHPDLINNIHQVGNVAEKLPGETRGWDFVEEDSDTRLEQDRVDLIQRFRNAFLLDSNMIKWRYPKIYSQRKNQNPNASEADIIITIRQSLLDEIAGGSFHGTAVAGVIAANPQDNQGVYGVAPQANILPVMAGVAGFSAVDLIESIGYSAFRGADIINLSLGWRIPILPVVQSIQQILQANPNLVIVAASGNDNSNEISYPAAIPGVISVGATNFDGMRASYSNFGSDGVFNSKLTVVAPGGDFVSNGALGGVLTTGGTAQPLLMEGLKITGRWGNNWDLQGKYLWTTGTSFAAPAVSGVIALIKGEDTQNRLTRRDIIDILQQTASYDRLQLTEREKQIFDTTKPSNFNGAEEYFFGAGLVDAEAAVAEAKARLN